MHAPEFVCSFYSTPKVWDGSSHQAGLSTYNICVEIACLFLLWQGSFQQQSCGLILFGGHPDYLSRLWMMSCSQGLHSQGHDTLKTVRVPKGRSPSGQGRSLRKTNHQDWSKEDTDFPLTWSTQDLLWNTSTPLSASVRARLQSPSGTQHQSFFLKRHVPILLLSPRHDFITQTLPVPQSPGRFCSGRRPESEVGSHPTFEASPNIKKHSLKATEDSGQLTMMG